MDLKIIKAPGECINLNDVRTGIDKIDKTIVDLLGKRYEYVKIAAQFKPSKSTVNAPDRVKSMMEQRCIWAEEVGLDASIIEKIYTELVNYFIEKEVQEWEENNLHK